MLNRDLIIPFQKSNKKTVFDLDKAVTFAINNSVKKLNSGQIKKTRILINKVQKKYVSHYVRHHYIQKRVDEDIAVQNFLNKEFIFPVSNAFFAFFYFL